MTALNRRSHERFHGSRLAREEYLQRASVAAVAGTILHDEDGGGLHAARVAASLLAFFEGAHGLKLFKPRLAGQIPFGPIIDGLAANENIGLSCRVAYSKDFRELLEGKAQATPIWPWHGRPV